MTEPINAHPTKRLVAYVLTKDIQLEDAVLDLIDNSIDGARRSKRKLSNFSVRVDANKDFFRIEDNCGGIPYEVARDYAFRFGRPEDYAPLDGPADLIGNFGVGMKRALLKMGRTISIHSRTEDVDFEIDIDVESWLKDDKNWNFEFSRVDNVKSPKNQTGTSITVTNLYKGVSERFSLNQFSSTLRLLAKEKQATALVDGLNILINSEEIAGQEMKLQGSKLVQPFHKKFDAVGDDEGNSVSVEIYAGLDASDNERAGWYVVCNGRTVLRADRSAVTGWSSKMDGDRVPSYHHQYARFRGYLILQSDAPNLLPWNTTKTGVDAEHPLYRRCLQDMIVAMKQVFAFLNAVDRESDTPDTPLTDLIRDGALKDIPLQKIKPSSTFVYPAGRPKVAAAEKLRWVRYQRPVIQVTQAMEALGADSPEEVGERTFDLYYELNVQS